MFKIIRRAVPLLAAAAVAVAVAAPASAGPARHAGHSAVHCTITVKVAIAQDGSEDDPGVSSTCSNGRPASPAQIRHAMLALMGMPANLHLYPARAGRHPAAIVCMANCNTSALVWSVDGD